MLKIGFDARMVSHSGIGSYIRGILPHLTAKPDLDFTLFGDLAALAYYPAKKVLAPFPIYSLKQQIAFPILLARHPVDLFHLPHYDAPLGCRANIVVTIHDLIHLRFPPSRAAYVYARAMLAAVTRKARRIIASSRHTKKDLMELIGAPEEKIEVIHLGLDEALLPKGELPARGAGDYLLYVGNLKPHKNVPVLVEAFRSARKEAPEMKLLLVGKDSMPDYTRGLRNDPAIEIRDGLPHGHLGAIYRKARMLVHPSLYEGFGLTPLEAMAQGVPVLSSNAASLPEVVGDAALLFDPKDIPALASHILRLWHDAGERASLVRKGYERIRLFSWKRCAEEIARVYAECL